MEAVRIILLLIFIITFFLTTVYENYARDKENDLRYVGAKRLADKYGVLWHRMQWINWFLTIAFILYLHFNLGALFLALILLSGALWWILYDGLLNTLKKRYFFYQSTQTTNEIEAFGNLTVKLIYLILSIILFVVAI